MRKLMRRAAALAAAGAMVVATAVVTTGTAQAAGTVLTVDNAIEGRYIVVLNDDAYTTTADLVAAYDGKAVASFSSINGFAAELSASDAAKLAADPAVEYVQQDGIVSLAGYDANPPWGLDRIDRRHLPMDNYYTYPDSSGDGVTAYIIDTGADLDHPDFSGRMSSGIDTVDGDMVAEDCNGHGTHVAGTVGGTDYGVAKKADMVAVRVLNCAGSGSFAGIIEGIDWVTQNAALPAVANMSLGGGFNQAVNDAVEASVASGVTYAVAAGNDYGYNACNLSPASAPSAITVGATDSADNRAGFSNIGGCLDIFAPGVDITSAWLNGGSNTISGTSMATPHVAGAAALHLGEYPTATPGQVTSALVSNATSNLVGNPGGGSPNRLLYMGYLNDPDGYSLSLASPSGTMMQGEALLIGLNTAVTSGGPRTVTFAVSGVPANVDTRINPSSVTTDNGVAEVMLSSTIGVPVQPGTYTIRVTAYGPQTRTVDFILTVLP